LNTKADALRGDGATALFLAIDAKPGGVIALPTRSRQRRKRPSIAFGVRHTDRDAEPATTNDGRTVARKLGIQEVEAEYPAEDKKSHCQKNSQPTTHVAMAVTG